MGYVNQISEALRTYRAEQQIDQKELGRRLGIVWRTVYELEKGMQYPALSTFRSMAALFGWSVEEAGAIILSLPDEPNTFRTEEHYGGRSYRPRDPMAEEAVEDHRGGAGPGDWSGQENSRLPDPRGKGDDDRGAEEASRVF